MKKFIVAFVLLLCCCTLLAACGTGKTPNAPANYSVQFNIDRGSSVPNQTIASGGFAVRPNNPTKTGYTFDNWYSDSNKTVLFDFTEQSITSDTTIYAKWTANTYMVTFDKQGGIGGSDSVTATYDSAMPVITTMPTRTGYKFSGFCDASTGGTKYYYNDLTIAKTWDKTSDTTLYAQWKAITTTVSFNANGGSNAPSGVAATYDSAMPVITTMPTRTGYEFSGFFDASTGGTKYYNNDLTSAKTWDKTSDTTLYAQWKVQTYSITYKDIGNEEFSGTFDTDYPTSHTYGTETVLINPTKVSYIFAGWFTNSAGTGTAVTSLNATDYTADITLYAKWTAMFKFTIYSGTTTYSVSVAYGVTVALSGDITIPETYNGIPVTQIDSNGFRDNNSANGYARTNGITSITLPSGVTRIGNNAFFYCTGLTNITIPSGVTSIGSYAFRGCTGLTSITIPSGVTSIGEGVFYNCTGLTSITLPSGVTSIGDYAFSGCTGLTSITLPSGVTSIGDSAFCDCARLTSITIPSGVTSIGANAFYYTGQVTIYAEAASKPSGWNSSWNFSNNPVIWGCTLSTDKTYVVSFTKTASSITNPYNHTITAPYRAGCIFGGWTTTEGGTTAAYTAADVQNAPIGTTLYAIWIVN